MYRNPNFRNDRARAADAMPSKSRLHFDEYLTRTRTRAFDAGGASGFAFLQSQLELIKPELIRPAQSVTYEKHMPIAVGGGFPEFASAFASNYRSTATKQYGFMQGTNNTEIPQIQVDVQKAVWDFFPWAASFTLTYFDLKRMETAMRSGQPAPISLQQLYENGVRSVYFKGLDYMAYWGVFGKPGLVNSPDVPATTLPNGASGQSKWSKKTPQEILQDCNYLITQTAINSAFEREMIADTILVRYSDLENLTSPMVIGGVGYDSTLDYIKRKSIATAYGIDLKIDGLPDDWLTGQGTGSTNRAIAYRNSKETLEMQISTPLEKGMSVPTTQAGGAYETIYVANVSQVKWYRTISAAYGDGI